MDFKVLYEVTVNGNKKISEVSDIIGTGNNCNVYWNPTLYFNIVNPPTTSGTIKLILLTSRSGENNWYYSKATPISINQTANQPVKFTGETAAFGKSFEELFAHYHEGFGEYIEQTVNDLNAALQIK